MKTTKKIFAAFLAVMMLALMIPFSASAAEVPEGPYTATYLCAPNVSTDPDKVGNYTFSFFKVADLNTKTGEYTVISALNTNTAIVNAVKSTDAGKTQALITACDTVYATDSASFGTAATTISFTADETTKTATLTDAGIYYIYCTAKPGKVTSVLNSVVALPYYSNNGWVKSYDATTVKNLATKVSTSSVSVTKTADKVNVGDDDKTVTYTLTASTTGSLVDNKTTKYAIVDKMDNGLTFNENSVVVKLGDTGLKKGANEDYTVETNYAYKDADGADQTATFAVVLNSSVLNTEAFYKAGTVTVTFTADINSNAKFATAIPNTDGLVYGNASGTFYEPGQTVEVFTYGVKVKKFDGTNNNPLANAEFTIYTDDAGTTELKVDGKKVMAKTTSDGTAVFMLEGATKPFKFDKDTTYYAKETKAPANYNINSTVFTVTVGGADYTWVNGNDGVANYPLTVPQTGGMGTMMFTICGAALILCAGILFLVVRRKNTAE